MATAPTMAQLMARIAILEADVTSNKYLIGNNSAAAEAMVAETNRDVDIAWLVVCGEAVYLVHTSRTLPLTTNLKTKIEVRISCVAFTGKEMKSLPHEIPALWYPLHYGFRRCN